MAGVTIFQQAGLHTDQAAPPFMREARAANFKWLSFQVQNDTQLKPRDLGFAKSLGYNAGVWGVSYHPDNYTRDGAALTKIARDLQAQHLVMNVERSMSAAEADRLIAACAPFAGPKALITLVGVLLTIHAERFIAAGWDIMGEAYVNDQSNLTPAVAREYASRAGIPFERFSAALGMYTGANGRITGGQYAAMLENAGYRQNFNLWMLEHCEQRGNDLDLRELSAQANVTPAPPPPPPVPPVPPQPDPGEIRNAMAASAQPLVDWWMTHRDPPLTPQQLLNQRIVFAMRVLDMGPEWAERRAAMIQAAGFTP